MINEYIFLIHIATAIVFLFFFVRAGKEGIITMIALSAVIANFFVLKQIVLFDLTVTCTDIYIILSALGISTLEERYGQKVSRQALSIATLSIIFFMIMSLFQRNYESAKNDLFSNHYTVLLAHSPRIVLSSIFSYLLSNFLCIILLGFLHRKATLLSFNTRAAIALLITQFVDTIVYSTLALSSIALSLVHIVAMSYSIKAITILITIYGRTWLERISFNKKSSI